MPNPLVKTPESPFTDQFRAGHPSPIDLTEVDLGKSPRIILDRIADLVGADEHAILLFDRAIRTIRGHKSVCLHLLFMFSEPYANLLRATGWARFDGKRKCWYLPEEFVTEELLAETFSGRFTHVVDLDADLLRTTGAAAPAPPLPYLELLPAPVSFCAVDVIAAYGRARPQDVPGGKGRMGIFDASRFSDLPEGPVATRYPLVLLRFPVEGGHPRYVTFSPLSGELERVSFYKESSRAIARFHDVMRSHRTPVLEPAEADRGVSLDHVSALIRAELAPFIQAAERVSDLIPDADLSVLHGAYLELLDGEGNREANRVHGKVRVRSAPHLTAMARALGQSGSREVVFHPRSFIGQEPELPLITLVHELAHHLINESWYEPEADSHDVLWATVCVALLSPFKEAGHISSDQLVGEVVPYLSGMGYPDGAEFSIALNGYGWFKDTIETHGGFSCEDLINVIRESLPPVPGEEGKV